MGMYDDVVLLDEPLTCPAGHSIGDLQTKSFADPSLSTYLVHRSRIFRAATRFRRSDDESQRSVWRLSEDEAVHEKHYRLESVELPVELEVYAQCEECEPVLVRTNRDSLFGDIVREHELFVEYSLRFPPDGPMTAERVTGDRAALMDELRENGLRVLGDDEPLAVAHREMRRARCASRR